MHFCLNGKAGIWWRLRKVKNKIYTIMVILLKIPGLFTGKLPPNNAFSVKLGIISSAPPHSPWASPPPPKKGLSSNALYIAHIHSCLFFFFMYLPVHLLAFLTLLYFLLTLFYFSACQNRIIETWALSYNLNK